MSAAPAVTPAITPIRARKAGFLRDLLSVARRAVRSISRDMETLIPALLIPSVYVCRYRGRLAGLRRKHPRPGLPGLFSFR